MKTDMPEIGKILDNAFAMGKSPTPSDYQELKSGMVAKITELTLKQVLEARIDENSFWFRVMGDGNIVTAHDHLERIADLRKELEDA